jgi:hypothetical protein
MKILSPSITAADRIARGPFQPDKCRVRALVRWVSYGSDNWDLVVGRGKHPRTVATVWANGTWSTWNRSGTGAENDKEDTVKRAKIEASASAISQGFI